MNEANKIIELLKLEAHPEGGYFREVYRSKHTTDISKTQQRNLATSIFFLLSGKQISALHRLKTDEIWYFHLGSPLNVCFISNGKLSYHKLGNDLSSGHEMQLIIPAGTIFGAELIDKNSYCLFGCMVNPGFDYEDFELLEQQFLLEEYPQHAEIIQRLTTI